MIVAGLCYSNAPLNGQINYWGRVKGVYGERRCLTYFEEWEELI